MIGLRLRSPDRMIRFAGRFSSGLLALVVLWLVAFNVWTTGAIHTASDRAEAYGAESDSFQQARLAMSEEESFGRKYRLQPAPEWKTKHTEAAALLVSSLNGVLAMHEANAALNLVDDTDASLIRDMLATHAIYLDAFGRMLAAFDAGNVTLSDQIDVQQVDPAFTQIVNAVDAAATSHRQAALAALSDLDATEGLINSATPIVLGTGVVLLVLFGLVMRGYQRQVRHSGQRFQSLVQNASDAVAIVDTDGLMTYASPAASRVLGHDPATLVGTNALALVHPDDASAARALLADASVTPDQPIKIELRLAAGGDEVRDFEVIAINLMGEPAIQGIVMNYRDVSERKAFERELKRRAFHDELTGLPNRALFLDRLEHAIARTDRRATVIAVLFLDLDHFKVVNDSLGHDQGDVLLAAAGARLRASLRKGETLARLGGDEFTILLEDLASEEEAIAVAERVQASLEVPFVVEEHEIAITASIGIAVARRGRTAADTLLRNADLAMYRAKGDGRAGYRVFDDGMEAAARERLGLREDLRRGLDRDEFRVFYQPIVSLADRSIVEFEALVRWERPENGLIGPDTFIPVAEETGLIVPLGQWVLAEACRQAVEWRDRNPDRTLTMCVNLSTRQFQHPDLVADISATLARTGLAAASLKLEITESVAMKDAASTARTLGELAALGIRIAIDDFGTGYSSLSYLRKFPIDTLKIDRSFVTDLGHDAQGTAIAKSIIALARTLHVSVTAEGVETGLQETILRRIGCDLAQGYLFGRPLPAAEAGLFVVGGAEAPLRTA
jgi:diguanylate cyclase (GGDEF)-like protein/PAS domain S-box-containing protein